MLLVLVLVLATNRTRLKAQHVERARLYLAGSSAAISQSDELPSGLVQDNKAIWGTDRH